MDPKDLNPLPVTEAAPVSTPPTPNPDVEANIAPIERDPIGDYLAEEAAREADPAHVKAPNAPVAETKPADDAQPNAETKPAAEAKVDAKPTEPAKAPEGQPAPQPQAAPQPQTLADDERFTLAPDIAWSRAEIKAALQERQQLFATRDEHKAFVDLFGMNSAEATKAWTPILERLRSDAPLAAVVDAAISGDSEFIAFLDRSVRYYRAEVGDTRAAATAAPTPQQPAPLDPRVAAEIDASRQFRERVEREGVQKRVQAEAEEAKRRYPFLATDAQLWADLVQTAQAMHARDSAKTLLDALAMKAPFYERLAASAAPAPAPTPVVPATLGSSGAQPGGSRPARDTRPRKFKSPDEATADWLRDHPE